VAVFEDFPLSDLLRPVPITDLERNCSFPNHLLPRADLFSFSTLLLLLCTRALAVLIRYLFSHWMRPMTGLTSLSLPKLMRRIPDPERETGTGNPPFPKSFVMFYFKAPKRFLPLSLCFSSFQGWPKIRLNVPPLIYEPALGPSYHALKCLSAPVRAFLTAFSQ